MSFLSFQINQMAPSNFKTRKVVELAQALRVVQEEKEAET